MTVYGKRSGGQPRDTGNANLGTTSLTYGNDSPVLVVDYALSTKDFNKTKLAAYYNSRLDTIVVDNAVSGKYAIYNLLGQSVLNGEFSREISVSTLKSCMYILTSASGTLKFAKY
ncbi:hypothetical protein KFZ70_03770 [Tamlana fucoidanivorans]|uniref:T9SS type A sorting domain-containing protein n=1 Tax=Allotamlana fucoidanivorans TaxID=2583814 RepID=A0A5C4SK51_9FLAO|nr:hypothetical protein [Tamlana fucoidanivorans]TNJ44189.1 hypothetical protein FGF67_09150 [Tamlana fucoidanivorans]